MAWYGLAPVPSTTMSWPHLSKAWPCGLANPWVTYTSIFCVRGSYRNTAPFATRCGGP